MFATANHSSRWFGAAREVSPCVLPGWAHGPQPLALYWFRPEQGEGISGLGKAASITSQSPGAAVAAARSARIEWVTAAPDVPGPWVGGFAFDGARDRSPEWEAFGRASFHLPASAVATRGGRTFALAFCAAASPEDAQAVLEERLRFALEWANSSPPRATATSFVVEDDRAGWDALVARSLEEIDGGRAEKIVAARRARLAFKEEPKADFALLRLSSTEPGSATFLLRAEDGSVFFGATPETLIRSEPGAIYVDALAGTLPEGPSGMPDDKLLREHQVVVDGIVRALCALPARVEAEPVPRVRALRHVRHLLTPIVARLEHAESVADAVAALHPTAAVAGAPSTAAIEFLRAHEGFDRGWYAGGVGVVGPERVHLCVALRSALLNGKHGWAYAGAGLVRGSVAEAEWDETARKLRTVLGALGGEA